VRAFVLCTGRCGSKTLAAACSHITNYTVGHETRARLLEGRLDYPDWHIEIDNRLVWFLGGLEEAYGDDPLYVHLHRDPELVAASHARRYDNPASIVRAFAHGVLGRLCPGDAPAAARLMVDTVTANIRSFLFGKPWVIEMSIHDPHGPFDELWDALGADGDRDAAHGALDEIRDPTGAVR
jgi:hypothetical protein